MRNDMRDPITSKEMDEFKEYEHYLEQEWQNKMLRMKDMDMSIWFKYAVLVKHPQVKLQLIRMGLKAEGFTPEQIEIDLEHFKREYGVAL